MREHQLLVTISLFLSSSGCFAQAINPLELQPGVSDQPNRPVNRFALHLVEAFDQANQNNPEITAALRNLEIARAQTKIARAIPNPQFALQYGFGNPYTQTIAGNTQQVGFNQLVETGGKRSARSRLAKENYKLTELQLNALRFDIHGRVRRAYAELAAAEANIDLIENQRSLVERLYSIAATRVKNGEAPEAESIQAHFAIDQFETSRTTALARLRQASIKLDFLLGFKPERDIDVQDNSLFNLSPVQNELVPSPDMLLPEIQKLVSAAQNQRPDLLAAKEQIETNSSQLSLSRRQAIPDVLVGSGFVFSTYKRNQNVPPQLGAYLNVNVDVPIFYRREGEVNLARANVDQARMQMNALHARVETEVHSAYAALLAARRNILRYQQELIPHAREVVHLAQRSYEAGRADISNAIVAQQSFQQTISTYFDAVVTYQNSWADLEQSIGAPLSCSGVTS
ncbi:MAG TPA: TolC family protein [Drouetiella sp.]